MRIYPVKENPIGSAVIEILQYRQTDRHRSCYFTNNDYYFRFKMRVKLRKTVIYSISITFVVFLYRYLKLV